MPPKNTSTDAYMREDPTDVPHTDVESDFETGESSKSDSPTSHKEVTTSDNPEDNVVTVSHDSSPSSTASDMVLKSDLRDIQVAANLHRKWIESDLSAQEKKAKMKEVKQQFDNEKKARERKEEDDMKKKYEEDEEDEENGEGKGKGKKV
jgi:uncharacterized protein YqfA (UPF0365 family)